MLWLITYESSREGGGESKVVVEAESADLAEIKAADFMEESMRELFSDHYDDEEEQAIYDGECSYTVVCVELFDETHAEWSLFKDKSQAMFYPLIG